MNNNSCLNIIMGGEVKLFNNIVIWLRSVRFRVQTADYSYISEMLNEACESKCGNNPTM